MNKNERTLLNTDMLRTFSVIADCGNLTVAAGRLYRTQSAVSVQLRKLETDLGVALFERSSKGMVLTDAGQKLRPRAQAILEDLKQTCALFESPLSGSIRVGIPDDFDANAMEQILHDFAQAHPDVEVEAMSGCTSGYPAALKQGTLDIAVCSSSGLLEGEELEVEHNVWIMKKGASLQHKQQIPLAILDRNCWWRDIPITALGDAGKEYRIVFRSSNFENLKAAIRAGFAIGVLPQSCVEDGLQILKPKDGFPKLPASRRFIQTAADAPKDLATAMVQAIKSTRHSVERNDCGRIK